LNQSLKQGIFMKLIFKTLTASTILSTAFCVQTASANSEPADPNPSARFGTAKSSNWFLAAEALWLKPLTEEIASTIITSVTDGANQKLKDFQNQFQIGVRAALGWNTCYDGWDLVLSYIGFNYKHNNPYHFVDIDGLAYNPTNDNGTISYTYNLNWGDLDLGRMFKVSRHLRLRPHAGIRSVWLNQKAHIDFKNIDDVAGNYYKDAYKSTLVGVEIGLDSLWMLSKEFSIYANLGISALSNSQNANKKYYTAENSYTNSVNFNYNSRIINNFDISLGLRWDKNFSNDKFHFGVNVGYEMHSFLNINDTATVNTAPDTSKPPLFLTDQDFTLQGIALGARFDF
jgi:Legionella pneumophila major outer membrane protein precursor